MNKSTFQQDLRHWLTGSACVLACAVGAVGMAVAKEASPRPEVAVAQSTWQQQMQATLDAQRNAAQALKAENEKLLSRLDIQEQRLMDTQRKSVDWWLTLLGVLGGTMALLFAALPLLWTYNERKAIKEKLTEADKLLDRIQGHADKAGEIAADMSKLNQFQSGKPEAAKEKAETLEQAKLAQQSTLLSDRDRLRAQAVEASQVEQPTEEQALRAYELWNALTVFDATDQNAQFNAGYWAQELFEKTNATRKKHWLEMLSRHYKSLSSSHAALNNWGNALSAEAQEVAMIHLPEARKLWAQASQKYELALRIKADTHEAACNWGGALAHEAKEVAKTDDLAEARKLWAQASQKYELALRIKADMHEAANNWGSALAHEAKVVAKSGLPEARKLWAQASQKYELALRIKADLHEAANNWGVAYLHEFHALRDAGQSASAAELLQKVLVLLEGHITQYPQAAPEIAYNLACAYALSERTMDTVAQLELSRQAGELPDHWPEDKDLDPIRQSPEYIAWVQAHFPEQFPKED